jgi:hypothetical protein
MGQQIEFTQIVSQQLGEVFLMVKQQQYGSLYCFSFRWFVILLGWYLSNLQLQEEQALLRDRVFLCLLQLLIWELDAKALILYAFFSQVDQVGQ